MKDKPVPEALASEVFYNYDFKIIDTVEIENQEVRFKHYEGSMYFYVYANLHVGFFAHLYDLDDNTYYIVDSDRNRPPSNRIGWQKDTSGVFKLEVSKVLFKKELAEILK